MSQPTTSPAVSAFPLQRRTARARLAALGVALKPLDLFSPIRERVHVAQKTVR